MYREAPVPHTEVRVYANETDVGKGQTDPRGSWKSAPIGFTERGIYALVAKAVLAPRLVGYALVESDEVTLAVGYNLIINPAAGGTTNPAPGTYKYQAEDVTVTAQPASGYVFGGRWILDGKSVEGPNPVTVVMGSDHTIEPVFNVPTQPPGPTPPSGPTALVAIENTMDLIAYVGCMKDGMYSEWAVPPHSTQTRDILIDTKLDVQNAHQDCTFAENPKEYPTISTWTVTGPITLHVVWRSAPY